MDYKSSIFNIKTQEDFNVLALEVFQFQFNNNPVYRSFCDLLYKHPSDVSAVEAIPFLPISFFKSHRILSASHPIQTTFTSSGTSGQTPSKHYVTDINFYIESFTKSFAYFFDEIESYTILALLPSYLEREGSSLVYMVNNFIKQSKQPKSGFFLNDFEALAKTLHDLEVQHQKTLLIGVSFALLDFVEQYQFHLKHTIVMETGGMKGKRRELVRDDLHQQLQRGFGVKTIYSEYGMTELFSQAYSKGQGVFDCPPWMKVIARDPEDALSINPIGKTGGLNIIDLANLNSCAFIATQDLGKTYQNGTFEVLGRFDHSDIRGCNLMVF